MGEKRIKDNLENGNWVTWKWPFSFKDFDQLPDLFLCLHYDWERKNCHSRFCRKREGHFEVHYIETPQNHVFRLNPL